MFFFDLHDSDVEFALPVWLSWMLHLKIPKIGSHILHSPTQTVPPNSHLPMKPSKMLLSPAFSLLFISKNERPNSSTSSMKQQHYLLFFWEFQLHSTNPEAHLWILILQNHVLIWPTFTVQAILEFSDETSFSEWLLFWCLFLFDCRFFIA